jgi:hypothetical protein
MTWLRSGNWIVNTGHVSAVAYDGTTIEIYLAGESHQHKGGFSAEGEEAERLWHCFCALSTDVLEETLHRRVKRGDSTGDVIPILSDGGRNQ